MALTLPLAIPMEVAPYRLSAAGSTARCSIIARRSRRSAAPSTRPPTTARRRRPVLYIKPRNTLAACGDTGGRARRRARARDRRLPRARHRAHRLPRAGGGRARSTSPAISSSTTSAFRTRSTTGRRSATRRATASARSGRGSWHAPRSRDPDALTIRIYVDGELSANCLSTADLIRSVAARLLADVTEFMTLAPGDVLAVGAAAPAPRVRAGQRRRIEIDGLGHLGQPVRRAVRHDARTGRLCRRHARGDPAARRSRRRCVSRTDACSPRRRWSGCRRFEAGTVIALGLNYADSRQGAGVQRPGGAAGVSQGSRHPARTPRRTPPAAGGRSSCTTSASWP